jgi:hypothetical protein
MEREQTLQLAKQAGLVDWTEDGNWSAVDCDLVRFAELVAAHEREACARMVEDWDSDSADPREVADAIRARGNNDH